MPSSRRERPTPVGSGHPRVRQFIDIKRGRTPAVEPFVALEGTWIIQQALARTVRIEVLFVCLELLASQEATLVVDRVQRGGSVVLGVSGRVLRRMVDRDGPDGLAAIARLQPRQLSDIAVGREARLLVADGMERPGNLGATIRCADGAGASAVIVTGRDIRLNNPALVKATMGTLFSIPTISTDRDGALAWLRQHDFQIVAADPAAPVHYRHPVYSRRAAIVVGNERLGIGSFWQETADVRVSIPMLGLADSLNVGHASALLLYEALHQQTSPARPETP